MMQDKFEALCLKMYEFCNLFQKFCNTIQDKAFNLCKQINLNFLVHRKCNDLYLT